MNRGGKAEEKRNRKALAGKTKSELHEKLIPMEIWETKKLLTKEKQAEKVETEREKKRTTRNEKQLVETVVK